MLYNQHHYLNLNTKSAFASPLQLKKYTQFHYQTTGGEDGWAQTWRGASIPKGGGGGPASYIYIGIEKEGEIHTYIYI